jgi:hypothetical protein
LGDENGGKIEYGRLLERVDQTAEDARENRRLLEDKLLRRIERLERLESRTLGALWMLGGVWMVAQVIGRLGAGGIVLRSARVADCRVKRMTHQLLRRIDRARP